MIEFDLTDGVLSGVKFTGGCNGNLQGIGQLIEGRKAEEVMQKISGIRCGYKSTSCPDQLSKAIAEALRASREQMKERMEEDGN